MAVTPGVSGGPGQSKGEWIPAFAGMTGSRCFSTERNIARSVVGLIRPDGSVIEKLLDVGWDSYWQLSYRLAELRFLKAGTELQAVGWFDNSKNNPHNPDPTVTVTWGDQTYEEMMVGFFDIAVPANMDKQRYFVRPGS